MAFSSAATASAYSPRVILLLVAGVAFMVLAHGAQLSVLAVASCAFATVMVIHAATTTGFFNPLVIFILFTDLYVGLAIVLIWVSKGGSLSFFTYAFRADDGDALRLATEQFILIVCSFIGYRFMWRPGPLPAWRSGVDGRMTLLWLPAYLVGLGAVAAMVMSAGSLREVASEISAYRMAMRAGNLVFVLLSYFGYVGALLWFARNNRRSTAVRYGMLVVLLSPLLLLGERTGFIITVIAAAALDETFRGALSFKRIFLIGSVFGFVVVMFGLFRANLASEAWWLHSYKDLSMGLGFLVCLRENPGQGVTHLSSLLAALSSVAPGPLRDLLGITMSSHAVLTQTFAPWSPAVFSMGVHGDAVYTVSAPWTPLYYAALGALLGWGCTVSSRSGSALCHALLTGLAVRFAKGGLAIGAAQSLQFFLPLMVLAVLSTICTRRGG